jgi:hypothetical protein
VAAPKITPNNAPSAIDLTVNSGISLLADTNGSNFFDNGCIDNLQSPADLNSITTIAKMTPKKT